ncbi:MAG TPA: hypothetical protein VK892_11465 [Pyrinomonadaceae bacterium]|nr:hypothetical protein [Pyrinomonadaceae bacterium]
MRNITTQLENIKSRFSGLSKESQSKIIAKANRKVKSEPKDIRQFWLEIESYLKTEVIQ